MMSTGGFAGPPSDLEAFGRPSSGFFDQQQQQREQQASGGSYEASELQDCRQHLRMCAERIAELESITIDLENRLESQANDYVCLETEAAESQRRWKDQYEALESECESWRQSNSQLELKNQQLRNQQLRTERELHGILRKKYEFMEEARREERERIKNEIHMEDFARRQDDTDETSLRQGPVSRNIVGRLSSTAQRPRPDAQTAYGTTPFRNLNPHSATPEEVRAQRVIGALSDFFGITNNPRGGW